MTEKEMKAKIDEIFEKHERQTAVIEDLYRLAFPDYDTIEKINGHPEAGKELSEYLWDSFIEFDKKHHPKVIIGGAWMNWGFSTNEKLKPWEISTENYPVVYSPPMITAVNG